MKQAATVQQLEQFANNTTDSIEKNTTRGNSILKDRPSLRVDSIFKLLPERKRKCLGKVSSHLCLSGAAPRYPGHMIAHMLCLSRDFSQSSGKR